jgi:hypothetical protein
MKILFPLFNLPSAVSKSLEANLVDSERNNVIINNKKLQQNFLIMKALTDPTGQQECPYRTILQHRAFH